MNTQQLQLKKNATRMHQQLAESISGAEGREPGDNRAPRLAKSCCGGEENGTFCVRRRGFEAELRGFDLQLTAILTQHLQQR